MDIRAVLLGYPTQSIIDDIGVKYDLSLSV